jgi:hypothetical protein
LGGPGYAFRAWATPFVPVTFVEQWLCPARVVDRIQSVSESKRWWGRVAVKKTDTFDMHDAGNRQFLAARLVSRRQNLPPMFG